MPVRSLKQGSFFDPRFAAPGCLVPGTVPWLLANHREVLCPPWLFAGWRGSGRRGRCAWPAPVLMGLLVLRWVEEGSSRVGAMRRAESDIVWRAATGLVIGGPTPSERTMRDFEAFLRERDPRTDLPRVLLLHEHFVHLAMWSGVAQRPTWAMDSTPQYCYGAILDTVRLLGDGLRLIGRAYARATGLPLGEVAKRWKLPLLRAKSTKGYLSIDWRDGDERSRVITELAEDATRVVALVKSELNDMKSGHWKKTLVSRCETVLAIIDQDLEATQEGRLVIAQRVARNRVISITDPAARHGRKSKSQMFDGFKINVLGDLVGGLITAISVTPGNGHDAAPGHELVRRARRLRIEMGNLLADTAYGDAADRHDLLVEHGITLIAPPPPITPRGEAIGRSSFAIDFATMTATCPTGVRTDVVERVEDHATPHLRFRWPVSACDACPLRTNCFGTRQRKAESRRNETAPNRCRNRPAKSGRVLELHPYEPDLRAAREAWADKGVRRQYRARTQFERMISQVIRHGGRQARAWGLDAANLQVHAIAIRCNLELLAHKLAAESHHLAKAA